MTGFLGFPTAEVEDPTLLIETLDLFSNRNISTVSVTEQNYLFSTATRQNSPLPRERLQPDGDWILLFSGDIISVQTAPFDAFQAILDSRNFGEFSRFHGIWALAALNRSNGKLFLVTDRLAQHPLFFRQFQQGVGFSTELPSFCRLTRPPSFSEQWLHTCLYFQFPIGRMTFLQDVDRVPAATVIEYDFSSGTTIEHSYAAAFEKASTLLEGQAALERSLDTFNKVLPEYISPDTPWAIGFTAGWDARTLAAFLLGSNPVTYTYGNPGCGDILEAERAAKQLGLPHQKVEFDLDFEKQLPRLMLETVYLSGGLENCSRSTLLYVYAAVTENGTRFPQTMSGIGLDSIFRGHLGPALVSRPLATVFRGGDRKDLPETLSNIIRDVPAFSTWISDLLDQLSDRFGPLKESATHLKYFVYETAPKYFAGEANIARYYTTLRIPGLDPRIIDLAFSISMSALSFSNFISTHQRGDYTEEILQSFLISKASGGRMRSLPVYDVPPYARIHGRRTHQLLRPLFRTMGRVRRLATGQSRPAPLERHLYWYKTLAKERVHDLLYSTNCRISALINIPEYEQLSSDGHLLKVLLTAETIARLVENRWTRFW